MEEKPRPIDEIMAEMMRQYDRNPLKWGISISRGRGGYGDIFILSPEGELWQIKIDSVYKPQPLGMGMKVGGVEDSEKVISRKIPSYGFRPISRTHMNDLKEKILQDKPMDRTIREILSKKPAPLSEIGGAGVIHGPITLSDHSGYLSGRQMELDLKLKKSLDRLLYERGIGGIYV